MKNVQPQVLVGVLAGLGFAAALSVSLAQEKAPIKVGAISTLTGPASFTESAAAAKAYFDRVNAQGGIQGRKIEYISEDEKGDPAVATQAARRLVDDTGVVANVGSASILECSANSAYYVQKGLVSITGTGIDPQCFSTPNISPVNTGPFVGTGIQLYYASNFLKRDKICAIFLALPGLDVGYKEVIADWEKLTGKTLALVDYSFKPGDEPTPFILRAKQAGCQSVLFSGVEPMVIAWMQAVKAQNMLRGTDWLFLTPPYTEGVAKALGSSANGLIAASEFEPFTGNSKALEDWRSLMKGANVPLTSFAQGGYLAAKIFTDTLNGIKGEITRESVTKAFKTLKPYKTPLIGTPYTFGDAPRHNPNRSVKLMELRDGKWRLAYSTWVKFPEKK